MSARLTEGEGATLLALARAAIVERLFEDGALAAARGRTKVTPALLALRACFVTLETPDPAGVLQLRGCIGSTRPRLPTHEAVIEAARDAAFSDPRFPPLVREEVSGLCVSVSILTPMVPIPEPGAIVVGRDGVVLSHGRRQSLFLPEVAEAHGWTREELLAQLARKAGLPASAWREARLSIFQSERFGENGSHC